MTKAELEKKVQDLTDELGSLTSHYDKVIAERDRLDDELRIANMTQDRPAALIEHQSEGFLEPLLLAGCIAALRNPVTGIAYNEAEFAAYAPAFVDQAVQLHDMILARLNQGQASEQAPE